MDQTCNKMFQIKYMYKKERSPDSLFNLCQKVIVRNLNVVFLNTEDGYKLQPESALPSDICDPFIEIFQQNGGQLSDYFLNLFKNINTTKLTSVHIHSSSIMDDSFAYLLRHDLENLSIINCKNLSHITYWNIFKECLNLQSLTIVPNEHLTTINRLFNCPFTLDDSKIICWPNPNLKHLVLGIIPEAPAESFRRDNIFLRSVFRNYLGLRVLDLSHCLDVGSLLDINKLQYLHSLILFDVPYLKNYNEAILNICKLKSLIFLDMSQINWPPEASIFEDGNRTLSLIVKCLPNLMHLDISGTNLAGQGTAEDSPCQSLSDKKSDIPGLESRVDNPLKFLGLYKTMYNACQRQHIPAKIISGDANEIQLFNAAISCMSKPKLLHFILNDLLGLVVNSVCNQINQLLDILLEVLTRNVKDTIVQITGSAILYTILNKKLLLITDITVKGRIITTIMTGMECNKHDELVLRNGCLILFQLGISPVMILEFNRFVQLLLQILSTSVNEGFVQQISIHLINKVANQSNDKQRNEIGDAGATEKLMAVIQDRVDRRKIDNSLQVAWWAIENVTKGSPKNCKRFLDGNGIKYFMECLMIFPGTYNMMRYMMGTFGNVVEVKELRPILMQENLINLFSDLLFSHQEVSFNAAAIIAYLASDGHKAWTIKNPARCQVLDNLTKSIEKWRLDEININYRNIKSILELTQVSHTPQCVYWAVWALANLTKVHPDTYCMIVLIKNGMSFMTRLLEEEDPINQNNEPGVIHNLAQTVIDNCKDYSIECDLEQCFFP